METGQNGTLDLDLVWHSSEARIALVPPMSVKDRPLLWMVVRSQTYYPEHILARVQLKKELHGSHTAYMMSR